ncbi:MAG: aldehyde reductase [Anaerolineales bacterium]
MSSSILLTGASGFVAQHTLIHLLQSGYKVRATLRTLTRENEIRAIISKFADINDNLEFVAADLTQDANWDDAMRGCEYVLHIASPFPLYEPKHEDELILPAVEGTLRVLRAAHRANVKRVVIVSSVAAVYAGHHGENRTFDENDWSLIENNIGAYSKSKTLAERAAWEFIRGAENVRQMELAAINPPLILGPVLDRQNHTSIELIRVFLRGEVPGVAKLKMGVVDVRDVASALLLAMTTPAAAGKRFPCSAGTLWYKDIAEILQKEYAPRGYKKIPRLQFPGAAVRLLALWDKKIAVVVRDLDWDYNISSEQARRVLGWSPRSAEQAILAMAESLVQLGLA